MKIERRDEIHRAVWLQFGVGAYVGTPRYAHGVWRVGACTGAGREVAIGSAGTRDGALEALFAAVRRLPTSRPTRAGEHYGMAREFLRRARYCVCVAFERSHVRDDVGAAWALEAAVMWLLAAAKERDAARVARRLQTSARSAIGSRPELNARA